MIRMMLAIVLALELDSGLVLVSLSRNSDRAFADNSLYRPTFHEVIL